MTPFALIAIASLSGAPSATQEMPATPAAIVASRVRDVLSAHDSELAWKGLAGALPSMAVSGDADLESTFAAARLAQDMSARPDPVLRSAGPSGETADWQLGLGRALWWCALTLVLSALALATRGRLPRVAPPRREQPVERCGTARALASEGLPLHEIARRTGLAREAVTVLVGARSR